MHLKLYELCKKKKEKKVIADSRNSIPTKHNLSVNSEQKDDFQSEGLFLQEGGQLLGVHMDVEVNVRSHAAVHVDNGDLVHEDAKWKPDRRYRRGHNSSQMTQKYTQKTA